jgi:SAM-dependent methyltransferase
MYSCPVCLSDVSQFHRLPDYYYQELDRNEFIFSIFQFETLNQFQYTCPNCSASDRDRLYALYFKGATSLFNNGFHFLDIAPSSSLQRFILHEYPSLKYRSADSMMTGVDDKVDISQMDIFTDETFDFFICSHVLEHVEEDRKAMKELHRILKPEGKGIVMVPILLCLDDDFEDPSITTPEARWKFFGQDDHVRMYSKTGFTSKLSDAGFRVSELDISFFGAELFNSYGIHPRSVLYIVEK